MAIDYENHLNAAQLEAVTFGQGPLLVIAGAGSGKTRTVVYRLARLVEEGAPPESILLLTFTRKAAHEMQSRAAMLLGRGLSGVSGGTFHSFAFATLKRYGVWLGLDSGFTVLDAADSSALVKQARDELGIGKGDKRFPKKDTVLATLSKARNKELDVSRILSGESFHLLTYAEDIERIGERYAARKRELSLFDYDDLLFELERLLNESEETRRSLAARIHHLMVDEYQDTNLVQARLTRLLAGERGNVMAVGDDAQSIYAFRGADVTNILRFRDDFPGARVVSLEENYRSTQPILDLTNAVLAGAREKYDKHLFTRRADGPRPQLIRTLSDATQAKAVLAKVSELMRDHPLHEIAVLFRAGYHSYPLEVELNKRNIGFTKFGGIRFTEAAHVKDLLSYLRIVANLADLPAWQRALSHIKGVGAKTALKIYEAVASGDDAATHQFAKRFAELSELFAFLDRLRSLGERPSLLMEEALAFYQPLLETLFPDDHPRRRQGLDELEAISRGYESLHQFLADICLENPTEGSREAGENTLTLSTVHSAKGLEWSAVLVIDLVEDRFPSRRALSRPDDMEEERRLMYVACTRARDYLGLFVPESVHMRGRGGREPVRPSPFVLELPDETVESFRESFSGGLIRLAPSGAPLSGRARPAQDAPAPDEAQGETPGARPLGLGHCRHKIYGRGKIVEHIPPEKYRVNFPGFGLKVIIGRFLEME